MDGFKIANINVKQGEVEAEKQMLSARKKEVEKSLSEREAEIERIVREIFGNPSKQ